MADLTVTRLRTYLNAGVGSADPIGPTPSAEVEDIMQLCVDAAIQLVEDDCTLPAVYDQRTELALLKIAARFWEGRHTAQGVIGISDAGAVRLGGDADIDWLLSRYKTWRFA